LVCLMLANNETGVIQPAADAARLVRAAGGWAHIDAVEAAGKIAIDFTALGADTLALSAHKLGGPQGCGAVIARAGAKIVPRAGTENTAGIAGFGAAARVAASDLAAIEWQAPWRDALASRVKAAGAMVMGEGAPRLAQTLCFATPDFGSELQVMGLDL